MFNYFLGLAFKGLNSMVNLIIKQVKFWVGKKPSDLFLETLTSSCCILFTLSRDRIFQVFFLKKKKKLDSLSVREVLAGMKIRRLLTEFLLFLRFFPLPILHLYL